MGNISPADLDTLVRYGNEQSSALQGLDVTSLNQSDVEKLVEWLKRRPTELIAGEVDDFIGTTTKACPKCGECLRVQRPSLLL
jgi:hypothetical protein